MVRNRAGRRCSERPWSKRRDRAHVMSSGVEASVCSSEPSGNAFAGSDPCLADILAGDAQGCQSSAEHSGGRPLVVDDEKCPMNRGSAPTQHGGSLRASERLVARHDCTKAYARRLVQLSGDACAASAYRKLSS